MIRFPYRDVKDDDVDRPQVYRQQCHSRAVLIARNFRKRERSRVDKVVSEFERDSFFSSRIETFRRLQRGGSTSTHSEQRS